MADWKMPPIAKVYEALGAIGDGRVSIVDATHATVASSDRSKTYEVTSSEDCRTISSNDNASFWQGYLGYPAIAVIFARGVFAPDRRAIAALAGVAWKQLNKKFRNDYAKTIAEVEAQMIAKGFDPAMVREECDRAMQFLRQFKPQRGPRLGPAREKRG